MISKRSLPSPRVPLWLKIAFTLFCAVMIPVYLVHYGPTNFIYFCDQSVLLTLAGIWLESPLLVSMCAVGLLAPQTLWVVDFIATAFGFPLTGMTNYMFDSTKPLLLRALSGFHGWLPFLLLYLVYRLGYDRRALPVWTAMATVTLLVCFFLMPAPHPNPGLTPVNVNYVYGFGDTAAQTWMPAWAWLALLLVGLPALFFWPTHLALQRWMPHPPDARSRDEASPVSQ